MSQRQKKSGIHLSTVIVLILLAGGMLWVNFQRHFFTVDIPAYFTETWSEERGCPFTVRAKQVMVITDATIDLFVKKSGRYANREAYIQETVAKYPANMKVEYQPGLGIFWPNDDAPEGNDQLQIVSLMLNIFFGLCILILIHRVLEKYHARRDTPSP